MLQTGEVGTGSSNSTVSSHFDDSDSDNDMLKYGKDTAQSISNAYEPINKSHRGHVSNINVVDDLSSGTDSNDDEDISRPGISQTFYQPDFQRIKNNKKISANTSAAHDSARMSEAA
jgi:hypothetical protein